LFKYVVLPLNGGYTGLSLAVWWLYLIVLDWLVAILDCPLLFGGYTGLSLAVWWLYWIVLGCLVAILDCPWLFGV